MKQNKLEFTEKETEHNMLMQFIEQDCFVDTKKKMEYPPVCLSMGEKVLRSDNGDTILPIPIGTNNKGSNPFLTLNSNVSWAIKSSENIIRVIVSFSCGSIIGNEHG